MTTDSQHLTSIRNRMVEIYGVHPGTDYIRRLDKIIEATVRREFDSLSNPRCSEPWPENLELQDALRIADAMEKMPGGRDMLAASVIRLAAEVRRNLRSVR